jgi:hypothetical protein
MLAAGYLSAWLTQDLLQEELLNGTVPILMEYHVSLSMALTLQLQFTVLSIQLQLWHPHWLVPVQ